MIPAITSELLRAAIQTEGMIRAGLSYFQRGRVSDIEIDHHLGMVTASVKGSARWLYFTSIVFEDSPFGVIADSECDCPVGYSCKHAAALLYALKEIDPPSVRAGEIRSGLRIEATEAQLAPASGAVGDWLDGLAVESLAARIDPQPLCFVIEPVRAFKQAKRPKGARADGDEGQPRYILQIRAWRSHGYGSKIRSWEVFYPYQLQNSAIHLDPRATRLLGRMVPVEMGGDFGPKRAPVGRLGWQWLCEAVEAGLLRWKSAEGAEVRIANGNLKTRFEWRVLQDGRQMLELAAIDEALQIFAGDPPVFFDPRSHELGLIDAAIAPALTGRLLSMPPVAPADIPALTKNWEQIAGTAVAMPRIAELAEFATVAVQPVLRFMIDKVERIEPSWRRYRTRFRLQATELVRLEFDYAGHRVRAPAPTSEMIVQGSEGLMRFSRDLEAEQAVANRLARTALVPIALDEDFQPKSHQAWDHALSDPEQLGVSDGGYPELLMNDVATLEAEGWKIEYAPNWRQKWTPLDSDDAQLALGNADGGLTKPADGSIDWFDVELAALVGGQRVDILPALRRVLADGGREVLERNDDYKLALALGGDRFTGIRLGTVRPLIEALLRLALADRDGSKLRLNRFDIGTIHELAGSGLGWTNESALRSLARALHAPSQDGFVNPAGLVAELRPYQQAGVAWLQALYGASFGGILADDMGLGKTLQAIAHILHLRQGIADEDRKPVLIVAPTSVLPNWLAELARFAPELDCVLWHGADRHRQAGNLRTPAIVVTSYPLLARDKDLITEQAYDLVVLDEAHVLKNPKTAGFKAAIALKARQTIALSGTPIENRLDDVWSLASLTNPGLLGSFDTFRKQWSTPIEKQGDQAAQAAFARRLRPFMLRRTKDEVATELPPKTVVSERIELSEAQVRLYESQRLLMQKRVREEIDRVGLARSQIIILDAMLKLRQICCDPTLLPRGLGEGVASAKRNRLLEMLPELLGEGRRVIVFSQFTSMLDRIAGDLDRAGIVFEQLRGTTRDRSRPIERFQKGEVPLILVSLKAGGAGVNLTTADTVILYDPWWNPAVEAQAIDRAHRIGQNNPVFVHRLIATGTIEEKILALQERKQSLADMLWSEQARAGGPGLDDDDIAFLLG